MNAMNIDKMSHRVPACRIASATDREFDLDHPFSFFPPFPLFNFQRKLLDVLTRPSKLG